MSRTNDAPKRRRKKDPHAELLKHLYVIRMADDAMNGADMRKGHCYVARRNITPQAGDVAVVQTPDGLFARFYHPQTDGRIALKSCKYPTRYYSAAEIEVCGVVCDAEEAAQTTKERQPTERETRIAELRERLEKLNEDDEIMHSTARFQLEKQIYDLEREAERGEWPDLINA